MIKPITSPLNNRTKMKMVVGVITDGEHLMDCPVMVRVTHDKLGKSISLEAQNIMIEIPIELVADMIDTQF